MKAIQEWLGYSNFSTTANIHAHLDSKSKALSVQALSNAISKKKMKKCSLQILKNQSALSN